MNLCDTVKINKNSKSRIPVPVTKQRSSKLCINQKSSNTSYLQKEKTVDSIKTMKIHLLQKNTESKICSHSEKLRNLKGSDIKDPNSQNVQPLLKTNKKCASIVINNKTLKSSIKSSNKNELAKTAIMKSNVANRGIMKACNINVNDNSLRAVSSYKPKAKAQSEKSSIEDEKENFPSPKSYVELESCSLEGNQEASKEDSFSTEDNVEFEANEIYRKMILCNIELSPSNRKLMISPRLSSLQCQRPSVYQKIEIPNDPLKEALRALENTCLSVKRIKKDVKLTQSPHRDGFRDSIYTPRGNPNEEFAKRLEDFRLKQLQKTAPKSNKKVTFNLNIQECTPKNVCDIDHNLLKNSQNRLMQINERSEENTPNSPHAIKNDEITDNSPKHVHCTASNKIIKADDNNKEIKINDEDSIDIKYKEAKFVDEYDTAIKASQRTIEPMTCNKSFDKIRTKSLQILQEISCQNSPNFINLCDNKKVEKYTSCLETNNMQSTEENKIKQNAKIYTPKPISLSSKRNESSLSCKMNESYSPEFLINGKSTFITNLAPICTPFVLKSQAKSMMFSEEADVGPIPLKLDFTEEENDTPKKQTCKNHTFLALDNIVTIQKQLDYLADQECYLSLINENFPVICGRYLTNPVARTLNEGDDMHFIPI